MYVQCTYIYICIYVCTIILYYICMYYYVLGFIPSIALSLNQ